MDLRDKKIGFIGCGNMGGAILDSLAKRGFISNAYVEISDISKERQTLIRDSHFPYYNMHNVYYNNKALTKWADIIILAVKPHQLEAVLKEIAPAMSKNKSLVSIAAGVRLSQIEAWLQAGEFGDYEKVFRVMPNMFMEAGQGMIEICRNMPFKKQHAEEDLEIVKNLLICNKYG